jgi:thiol:disulfide interchange protein DsbA
MSFAALSRVVALFVSVLAFAPAAGAADASAPRLGLEYKQIPQQPITTGPRIEVVEFFWYGCPHCNQLQGPLEAWLKRKPEDVELRRTPAIFRESWVPHARIFYTLEALGELGRLHQAVYRAVHAQKEDLTTASSAAEWAARNGIDRARWLSTYNSPEIDRKIDESKAATRSYAIEGTPSLVVDGRYLTSSGMSDSYQGVIVILDDLVRIARERRPAKP